MQGNEGPSVGRRGTIPETVPLDSNRELHHALGVAWLRRAAPPLLVTALPLIAAVSCFKDLLEAPRAPVYRFSVSPPADTIVAGDTVAPFHPALTRDQATVPADLALRVQASASDPIVSVFPGGRLVGRACGVITLVAEPVSSGLPGSVPETTVTVTVVPARVSASPNVDTLHSIGETATLSASAWDTHASAINCTSTWAWRSEDTTAARVSAPGTVTAVRNGTTKIWVRAGLDSAFVSVTVVQRTKSVTVGPAPVTLRAIGATQALSGSPKDSLGTPLSGRPHHWGSSNTAAVAVDSAGLVTGVANGWAWVTDTVDGVGGSDSVTVSQVTKKVWVCLAVGGCPAPPFNFTAIGATQQLTAVPQDSLGTPLSGRTNHWGSSNAAAVTVSAAGLVTAVANGWAWVTDTVDGVPGRDSVTVGQVTKSLVLSPAAVTLTALGATQQLTATAKDSLGTPLSGRTHHWGSGDAAAVGVSAAGLVTAVANGWAWVTDTVDGVVGRDSVTVGQVTKSVTLSPAPVTLSYMGATQQLTATPRDSLGSTVTGRISHWASPDTSITTVSSGGIVTARKIGAVWIADTIDGVVGRDSIAVRIPAKNVTLTPSGATISGVGTTQAFSAVARDTFGTVIAGKTFTWTSLNPAIATVNASTGVVTAASAGQATISATADGLPAYGLATVGVDGPAANLLVSLASGTTQPLTDVWGTAPTNVYAVGGGGTVLHFDGTNWAAQLSGTSSQLRNAWGASDTSIFVVGYGGTVLRWNGSSWNIVASGTSQNLRGVWGTSPVNAFAVGAGGTILHWDGSSWSAMTSPTTQNLLRVWGTSPTDVYAVGGSGTVLHWNGGSWTLEATPTTANLYSVWGTSPSDVFAVGDSGAIVHWTGSSWLATASGTTQVLSMVWGTSPTNVYAVAEGGVVLRWDGSNWTPVANTSGLYGVGGASPTEFYAVGPIGTLLRALVGATVTVSPANQTLAAIGATQQFAATARDASGNVVSGVSYTWSSSDTTVEKVSATGLVTAVAMGTATITATAPGGASGSTAVTVSPPTITVTPASLSFSWQVGATPPAGQTLSITNAGGGTLSWAATKTSTWLNLSATSGTAPTNLTASVTTTGLTAGTYGDTVWISSTGATNTPLPVPVAFTVVAQSVVSLSPLHLTFTSLQGGANPASQTVRISNAGGGALDWSASGGVWSVGSGLIQLTVSPSTGTAPSTITVAASISSDVPTGTYTVYKGITVSAPDAANNPQYDTVTFTVVGPIITLNPTSLSFSGQQGGANPASQTLSVSNAGGGTLPWTASSNQTWLTVTPTSGTAPTTLTVSANTTGLAAGSYPATITVYAAGASNTPQAVPVTLTVLPPSPAAPSGLKARANSVEIDLSWTDNSTNETGFAINRCTGSGCTGFSQVGTVSANGTSYRDASMQPNTVYCYQVSAYNAGGSSPASSSVCAGSFSLGPAADIMLSSYVATSGSSPYLGIESNTASSYFTQSLVRFDLSAIPQTATIDAANLSLNAWSVSGAPTLRLRPLLSSWNEYTVTWGTMPAGDASLAATFPVSAGWDVSSVTTFVQSWVSGTRTNYGFELSCASDPANAGYYSREGSYPPILGLYFHTGP
ncbi:MAG: Ig-like domain-containing protein [Gemmatimonadales bacterium]|jgi:uncharacterized protein YjdB